MRFEDPLSKIHEMKLKFQRGDMKINLDLNYNSLGLQHA